MLSGQLVAFPSAGAELAIAEYAILIAIQPIERNMTGLLGMCQSGRSGSGAKNDADPDSTDGMPVLSAPDSSLSRACSAGFDQAPDRCTRGNFILLAAAHEG